MLSLFVLAFYLFISTDLHTAISMAYEQPGPARSLLPVLISPLSYNIIIIRYLNLLHKSTAHLILIERLTDGLNKHQTVDVYFTIFFVSAG